MAASQKKWVRSVKTDSTHPPEGSFQERSGDYCAHAGVKKVSPKGPGSGMRMLTYFINRAGKGLSARQKARLEKAKTLLSERVERAHEKEKKRAA